VLYQDFPQIAMPHTKTDTTYKEALEARLNPLSRSIDRLETQMTLLQSQTQTHSLTNREAVTQLRTEMKAAFKQVSDRLKQIEEKQTKRGWLV
jgi:chromosome segregation ATPase